MGDVKLSDIIQDLNQKVDVVYRHDTLQERYSAVARDYEEDSVLTESEAHTLGYVCEIEGATVTDLTDYSFRTKGTISKMLRKLKNKGLVEKFQWESNRECICVQPIERGKQANDIHRTYDWAATSAMLADLLKTCAIEEVESFFEVARARTKYFSREQASSEQ